MCLVNMCRQYPLNLHVPKSSPFSAPKICSKTFFVIFFFFPARSMANFDVDLPESRAAPAAGDPYHYGYMNRMQYNPRATCDYIGWIKSVSRLPVVCKGILTGIDHYYKLKYNERQKKHITSSEWHSLKSKASTWIIFRHRLGKFVHNKHM